MMLLLFTWCKERGHAEHSHKQLIYAQFAPETSQFGYIRVTGLGRVNPQEAQNVSD